MKDLINKIEVKEIEVEAKLEWLSQAPNNGHEYDGINVILRYLLKQNEVLRAKVDLLNEEK